MTIGQLKLFQLGIFCIALSFIAAVLLSASPEPALNVSGTWAIEVQIADLPRFSGKHQINLFSTDREIVGAFHPEKNCSFEMAGRVIAPNRVEFTLPIRRSFIKGVTFPKEVNFDWITFVGDIKRERNNRLSMVGSLTRFERDINLDKIDEYSLNGPVKRHSGTWRADQISTERISSPQVMLFSRHLEGTLFREDPASPTGFYIPTDLRDAIKELDRILPTAAKTDIRHMSESELWVLHQNFGLIMRDRWGLTRELRNRSRLAQSLKAKYIKSNGAYDDEMYRYILENYAFQLQSKYFLARR
ncbi:MAG: DUF6794 domain-containing protein [Candidatus Obscuribacterales bacterium]